MSAVRCVCAAPCRLACLTSACSDRQASGASSGAGAPSPGQSGTPKQRQAPTALQHQVVAHGAVGKGDVVDHRHVDLREWAGREGGTGQC